MNKKTVDKIAVAILLGTLAAVFVLLLMTLFVAMVKGSGMVVALLVTAVILAVTWSLFTLLK